MGEKIESPLAEADARSIDELFAADPLSLTNNDVNKITKELREKRHLWAQEEEESKTQGRRRRPSKYKEVPKDGKITLDLLGLTIKPKG